jgi:hypothetical protein
MGYIFETYLQVDIGRFKAFFSDLVISLIKPLF